jgi:putative hydrolase of the HAD superfamily
MSDVGTRPAVLFDFDGTLAERPGMWRLAVQDMLDEHVPGHPLTVEALRPYLRDGFPWHRPDEPHPELCDPDAWWAHVGALFEVVLRDAGAEPAAVPRIQAAIRAHYCDHRRFSLFPDTIDALSRLRDAGFRTVILSNHVPELPAIVEGLGLAELVDAVLTSAITGYEKPHPEAFRLALGDSSPEDSWMVGDNPVADVSGAEAVGLEALLVRHPDATLTDAVATILSSRPRQRPSSRRFAAS